jgi:hypothetical protein
VGLGGERGILQAFGLAERGNCWVDCLPGMEVLCTCSSKSSAEARFRFDILEASKGVLVWDGTW